MRLIMNISGTCGRMRNATCVMRDSLSATNLLWTGLTTISDTLDKTSSHVVVIAIDTSPTATSSQ
jgi:ribosomal protein L7Ae-like RNA K-turn-binding protein